MTLKDCFWCCYLLHVYRDIKLAHLPGMYEQISSKSDVQFRWNLQGYWRMSLGQISSLWLLHPMGIGPIRSRRMLVVVECLACFWSCVLMHSSHACLMIATQIRRHILDRIILHAGWLQCTLISHFISGYDSSNSMLNENVLKIFSTWCYVSDISR